MRKIFFYFLISLSFFSCKEIQQVTIEGVENTHLKSLSKEGIEFDFGLKIRNPNSIGVTVYPSDFDATINDIPVGKIKLTNKVKIKANSDNVSQFNIKSDFSKVNLKDIVKVLPIVVSKNATISIKGTIRAGKWFYKKKFPVDLSKNISLSK